MLSLKKKKYVTMLKINILFMKRNSFLNSVFGTQYMATFKISQVILFCNYSIIMFYILLIVKVVSSYYKPIHMFDLRKMMRF